METAISFFDDKRFELLSAIKQIIAKHKAENNHTYT